MKLKGVTFVSDLLLTEDDYNEIDAMAASDNTIVENPTAGRPRGRPKNIDVFKASVRDYPCEFRDCQEYPDLITMETLVKDISYSLPRGMRFSSTMGWLIREGGVWKHASMTLELSEAIKRSVILGLKLLEESNFEGLAEVNKYWKDLQPSRESDSWLQELGRRLQGQPQWISDDSINNPEYLPMPNGIWSIRNDELLPEVDADKFVFSYNYPYCMGESTEAPTFDLFFERAFGDEAVEVHDVIVEHLAHMLIVNRETQKCLWLYGKSGAGKSTLGLELIPKLILPTNKSLRMEALTVQRNAQAAYDLSPATIGSMKLLVFDEGNLRGSSLTTKFKALVNRVPLTLRDGEKTRSVEVDFKGAIIVTSNDLPVKDGEWESFERRIDWINFKESMSPTRAGVPNPLSIDNIDELLEAELPNILRRVSIKASELLRSGQRYVSRSPLLERHRLEILDALEPDVLSEYFEITGNAADRVPMGAAVGYLNNALKIRITEHELRKQLPDGVSYHRELRFNGWATDNCSCSKSEGGKHERWTCAAATAKDNRAKGLTGIRFKSTVVDPQKYNRAGFQSGHIIK